MKKEIELLEQLYEIREKECGNIPPYKTSKEAKALTTAISVLERIDMEFLRKISKKGDEMLTICQKENFVFNNLNDRWQKLAFTFYSEIVQLSSEAQAIVNFLLNNEN